MGELREYFYEMVEGTINHLDLRVNGQCEKLPDQKCVICGQPLKLGWTIVHGVADCVYCGCPYQVYHRNEKGELISRTPETLVRNDLIPKFSDAWRNSGTFEAFTEAANQIVEEVKSAKDRV